MVNCLNKIMSKINSKFLKILYLIIYLFDIIKSEILECQKDSPFRKYNQCTSEPCLKVEYDSNNCYINNTIIKNQWLNNIITFGELNFRYINIASYYNGDMLVETTSCPAMNKRIFFGLKQNGRPFFNNKINMEETLYYSNDIINKENDNAIGQFESIGIIVRHNDTKGEYYLSLPKLYDNAELFDFSNDNIYYKPILRFASFVEVHSLRHSFFPLMNINNLYDNYYLFCFVGQYSGQSTENLFIQKHIFKGLDWEAEQSFCSGTNEPNAFGETISCFQTLSEFIICFFMTQIGETSYLNLVKYDDKLENKKNSSFSLPYNDKHIFFKAIHIKGELGVFAYYLKEGSSTFPVLLFREFNIRRNEFDFYLSENFYPFSSVSFKTVFI